MGFLKDKLQDMVIGMILAELSEEKIEQVKIALDSLIKYGADEGLDYLEDYIAKTETKLDDKFLPVIDKIRTVFKIPDGDD